MCPGPHPGPVGKGNMPESVQVRQDLKNVSRAPSTGW